jgi:hypothetical protein
MLLQVETQAGSFDIQKQEPKFVMPNHSIQRMGASRLAQSQLMARRRLAPTADAGRYDWTKYEPVKPLDCHAS